MLSLPPTVRIWLSAQPADLRKSFDSLAALVREGLQGDPLSGDIFVFRNKAADRVKLLLWEEDGYAIWYKRLEVGCFQVPGAGDRDGIELDPAQLAMILSGIDLKTARRRQRFQLPGRAPAGA